MLSPRGYGLRYSLMILSHRVLRYGATALHVIAFDHERAAARPRLGLRRLPRPCSSRCSPRRCSPERSAAAAARGPLLRGDERWRSRSACGTSCAAARRLAGKSGGDAVIRRAVDVAVAASVLALAAPLLLLAAIAIASSRAAVIYRQRRVGRDGAEFDVLKLRTMVAGAEHIGAGLWVDAGDPRITRVGALLRRTSLDELPNLWNVLRGEMSLIGPRPTVPEQVAVYRRAPARAARGQAGDHRLGAGQRARRAALVSAIELDLEYIERRTLWLDLRIVWRTLRMLAGGEDLYRGETGGWDLPHVEGYDDAGAPGGEGSPRQ
jgi:lipopolysaccharide/colanic/teichoic acid biosynthesis glycosyltransferase